MKSITHLLVVVIVLLSSTLYAQSIKNAETETVKIYGNCSMCETTIEKAGNKKKAAKVDWDKSTKMASITYDSKKTSRDEILKRIALSGYDSDYFLAPDAAYANLHSCCQYNRDRKISTAAKQDSASLAINAKPQDMGLEPIKNSNQEPIPNDVPQLKAVFNNYYALKDALVKTDGNAAAAAAGDLSQAINAVNMEKLSMDEHTVWMKVMKDLAFDAEHISTTRETGHQRSHFKTLSTNMYALMKASKQDTPTYFQHCPMANDGKGADWLSKDSAIKNPYFGSQMLSCGKTTETLK